MNKLETFWWKIQTMCVWLWLLLDSAGDDQKIRKKWRKRIEKKKKEKKKSNKYFGWLFSVLAKGTG